MLEKKTILDIQGDPGSGLAVIMFTDGTTVCIESGFGLRQLANAFNGKVIGQEIVFSVDEFGLMDSFCPAEDYVEA